MAFLDLSAEKIDKKAQALPVPSLTKRAIAHFESVID